MLSIEAAVNSEPPSGTNTLQVRQGAQDFRHCVREVVAIFDNGSDKKGSSLFTAESLNGIDSLNPIGWAFYSLSSSSRTSRQLQESLP